jgi:hypothetical protein
VALRPDSKWHSAGERTGMVVGVLGGWVRVILDKSGRKVKIRCRDLAVVAIPIRCRALTKAIIESKDFR